jgi:hypothetical protein
MHQSRRTRLLRRWNSLTLWEQWIIATVFSEMAGLVAVVSISTLTHDLDVNPYGLLTILGAIECYPPFFIQSIILLLPFTYPDLVK